MTQSQKRLNNLDGKAWVKATKSWFIVNPKSRSSSQMQHPAKFPEKLVKRFLEFFTKEGSWVMDPFAGVGSTSIACKEMGRNSVAIELSKEFIDIGTSVLSETTGNGEHHFILGDSMNVIDLINNQFNGQSPLFDFVITSPPYWNMLRKSRGGNESVHKERAKKGLKLHYSESESDLGNIEDYNIYIDSMGELLGRISPLLSAKAYLVVVVQNMRDVDGLLRPIAWDLARRLSENYDLRQEMIWCQDNKKLGCWGYPTTYVSNVHHHYCLILQKRGQE
ncbi:MAG: DNA methyltransferase [Candidatus Thorarchaeota archaeon]